MGTTTNINESKSFVTKESAREAASKVGGAVAYRGSGLWAVRVNPMHRWNSKNCYLKGE